MATEVYDLIAHYDESGKPSRYHARGITGTEVLRILRGDLAEGEMEPASWEIVPHEPSNKTDSNSHLSIGSN